MAGTKITLETAKQFVKNYQPDNPEQKLRSLLVSVENIKSIFSQADCKFLRMYMAKKTSEASTFVELSHTLMFVGADSNEKNILDFGEIWDDNKPCPPYCHTWDDIFYEFDYCNLDFQQIEKNSVAGSKITLDEAKQLINNYRADGLKNKLRSLQIDACHVNSILEQEDCKYLRIYFAKHNAEKADYVDPSHTVVVVGADSEARNILTFAEIWEDLKLCPPNCTIWDDIFYKDEISQLAKV